MPVFRRLFFLPLSVIVISLAPGTFAADWPGWRGPTGQGQSSETNLPLHWGGKDHHNVLWKAALPGNQAGVKQDQNQSSPIVVGDRVFVTASYWPADTDTRHFPEHHVACYRATDGRLLWDTRVPHGPWSRASDLRGGYTASTPAADGERVYVVFGSAVLAALDHAGRLVWRREIMPYKFDVALAASPVLYRETLILQLDGLEGTSRLAAFDRKTGNPLWEQKRPQAGFAHGTPVLAVVGGRSQLLVAASNALQGVDPDNGKLLWWCRAQGDTVSPVDGNGLVYIDSGRGGSGVAVAPGGSGDTSAAHTRWRIPYIAEGLSSPIIVGRRLYRLCNPATLRCWDMADGHAVFTTRLEGVSTASSPIVTADGRIYCASGGRSYVLQAADTPRILARNDLDDASQASPAVAHGRLYIKGRRWLYCIGRPSPGTNPGPGAGARRLRDDRAPSR